MRILVDVNEAQIEALETLARHEQRSRASLIRSAVEDYLKRHHTQQVEDGFGLWGKDKIDGLAYQEEARREW